MRKFVLFLTVALFVSGSFYGLLRLEPVSRMVTPKKYWREKILLYNKQLENAKRTRIIKEIQLKKKIVTGDLDVAQDVLLGIDQGTSVSVVRGEIERLKESVADSDRTVHELEVRLSEAKERFGEK